MFTRLSASCLVLSALLLVLPATSSGRTAAEESNLMTLGTLCTVTSAQDAGPGTLRQCLLQAANCDTITFDPAVFPAANPTAIAINSALPTLDDGNVTIDASNAGVILVPR